MKNSLLKSFTRNWRLLLMTVLVISSVCSIFYIYNYVSSASDDVEYSSEVIYGDASAAEGISADLWLEFKHDSYWNLNCTFGSDTKIFSKFYPTSPFDEDSGSYVDYKDADYEIRLDTGYSSEVYLDNLDSSLPGEYNALGEAMEDLAAEILPGETKSKDIYLKDYFDFYRLRVQAKVPYNDLLGYHSIDECGRLFSSEAAAESWFASLNPASDQAIAQQLQSFFRIPVLPEDKLMITVTRGQNGAVADSSFGLPVTEHESAELDSGFCVMTDEAFYFTFQGHGSKGTCFDFSYVPGGYGIYRIPYSAESGLDTSQISMVYGLDPAVQILEMDYDAETDMILLQYATAEKYVLDQLYVPDLVPVKAGGAAERAAGAASGAATSETTGAAVGAAATRVVNLDNITSEDLLDSYNWTCIKSEDLLLVRLKNQLILLAKNSDGLYDVQLDILLPDEEDSNYAWPHKDDVISYDGEKLVCISTIGIKYSMMYNDDPASFTLAVYDKSGIAYYGIYTPNFNNHLDCDWDCQYRCTLDLDKTKI